MTDATPAAQIPLQKLAVQYTRDITRTTSVSVAASLLRGLLAKRRDCKQVGLITHRPLLNALAQLEPEFRERVVMSTYFGSGDERSSNAWHENCDLLLILGTPRVPPQAIAAYLVQVGEIDAACREPEWGTLYWQAELYGGGSKRIEGRSYHDDDWRLGHQDLVRAALVQSIGRGRLILEDGCDVVVLSSEECGLKVIDGQTPWLSEEAMQVLFRVRELTMEKSKRSLLEKTIVSTSQVAASLELSEVRVRELLRTLEWHGLVQRAGSRSGWYPVASPTVVHKPAANPGQLNSLAHAQLESESDA